MHTASPTSKRAPEAFVSPNLFEAGMGHVVISRFRSGGRVESGVFLLDVHCLGVKDAFYTQLTESEYDLNFLSKVFCEGRQSITPPCGRKLVEGAIAYARGLGFEPHPDFKAAARVLGGISIDDCPETFAYGKDGKPFYIQGPHDSQRKARHILNTLQAKCGEGNYHCIVLLGGGEGLSEL